MWQWHVEFVMKFNVWTFFKIKFDWLRYWSEAQKNKFVLPNMDFDEAELQKMTMLYKRFN